MIQVPLIPPETDKWRDWIDDCHTATSELIESGPPYTDKIRDGLYKRMRVVIFEAFHGKCAFCETRFMVDQTGDVEHFRPKGPVQGADNKIVKVNTPVGKQDHLGYYWLAYRWHNLLPACRLCNGTFKRNQFPLQSDNSRAYLPGDEVKEKPLLLHPVFDDPEKHLSFEPAENGFMVGTTDEGRMCVDVFGLNREGLPEERMEAYMQILGAVRSLTSHYTAEPMNEVERAKRKVDQCKRGVEQYSIAGRRALSEAQHHLTAILDLISVVK